MAVGEVGGRRRRRRKEGWGGDGEGGKRRRDPYSWAFVAEEDDAMLVFRNPEDEIPLFRLPKHPLVPTSFKRSFFK
ncbi:hypothetical protein L3X38_011983 [Prunus dulcis]|uniref:Uncharacterized protein n=1 Tax=Prunus dulcis TaxID=3755 RepID=A0AAD4ZFY2_PRUDU|nr:hypothetical protein L3X38_011983 [Prunus dulcis]